MILVDLSSSECLSKFSCPSTILAIDSQSVFIGRKNVVDICNFQGIIKQTLQIEENNIQQIKVFGQFLTVVRLASALIAFIIVFVLISLRPADM